MSQPFSVPGPQAAPPVAIAGVLRPLGTILGAGTNVGAVSPSCDFHGYTYANAGTVWAWLKLYNGTAVPTLGQGTPALTLGVPPSAAGNVSLSGGAPFPSGLGLAVSTGPAFNDSGTIATANQIALTLWVR